MLTECHVCKAYLPTRRGEVSKLCWADSRVLRRLRSTSFPLVWQVMSSWMISPMQETKRSSRLRPLFFFGFPIILPVRFVRSCRSSKWSSQTSQKLSKIVNKKSSKQTKQNATWSQKKTHTQKILEYTGVIIKKSGIEKKIDPELLLSHFWAHNSKICDYPSNLCSNFAFWRYALYWFLYT